MLDTVVRYLQGGGIAFRVVSYPSPEPLPCLEAAIPAGTLLVRTHVMAIGRRTALACMRSDASIDPDRLSTAVSGARCACSPIDLRDENDDPIGPLPPLAGFLGMPLFVDHEVAAYGRVVFPAYAPHDYVELAYADLAWLERPCVTPLRMRDVIVHDTGT